MVFKYLSKNTTVPIRGWEGELVVSTSFVVTSSFCFEEKINFEKK